MKEYEDLYRRFYKVDSIENLRAGENYMPIFNDFNEFEKYLKKNPQIILEENIGNTIEGECPICKENAEIRIVSKDKGKCLKCGNQIDITVILD